MFDFISGLLSRKPWKSGKLDKKIRDYIGEESLEGIWYKDALKLMRIKNAVGLKDKTQVFSKDALDIIYTDSIHESPYSVLHLFNEYTSLAEVFETLKYPNAQIASKNIILKEMATMYFNGHQIVALSNNHYLVRFDIEPKILRKLEIQTQKKFYRFLRDSNFMDKGEKV